MCCAVSMPFYYRARNPFKIVWDDVALLACLSAWYRFLWSLAHCSSCYSTPCFFTFGRKIFLSLRLLCGWIDDSCSSSGGCPELWLDPQVENIMDACTTVRHRRLRKITQNLTSGSEFLFRFLRVCAHVVRCWWPRIVSHMWLNVVVFCHGLICVCVSVLSLYCSQSKRVPFFVFCSMGVLAFFLLQQED